MKETIIKIDQNFNLAILHQQVIILDGITTYVHCRNALLTSDYFEIFFECDKIVIQDNVVSCYRLEKVVSTLYGSAIPIEMS